MYQHLFWGNSGHRKRGISGQFKPTFWAGLIQADDFKHVVVYRNSRRRVIPRILNHSALLRPLFKLLPFRAIS